MDVFFRLQVAYPSSMGREWLPSMASDYVSMFAEYERECELMKSGSSSRIDSYSGRVACAVMLEMITQEPGKLVECESIALTIREGYF